MNRFALLCLASVLVLTGCGPDADPTNASAPTAAQPAATASAPTAPTAFVPSNEAELAEAMAVGLALAYDGGVHYRCDPANRNAKRNADLTPNSNLVATVTFDGDQVVVTGDASLVSQKSVGRSNTDSTVMFWGFGVRLDSSTEKLFGVYVHETMPGTDRWLPYPPPAGDNGQYSFKPEQTKVWPEFVVLATNVENPCAAPNLPLPFAWAELARPGANVPYPYQHN